MSAGTDKIVSSILSDAQSKADAVMEEAEKEINSILEDGEKIALMEREKMLEDANKQSAMKYQQLISEAKMNSGRMGLEAREEVIEAAFKSAEEKLIEIASSDATAYKNSLNEIITEATYEVGGGKLIFHLKAEDTAKIKDSIASIEKDVKKPKQVLIPL